MNSNCRFAAALAALIAAAGVARAEENTGPVVEYICDAANGRLVVEYIGDAKRIKEKRPNRWKPDTLIRMDPRNPNHVAGVITVRRNCRLADGVYTFALSGAPNNPNLQGRCGAEISGRVVITRNRATIVNARLDGDCHSEDPIVTKITVTAGKTEPEIIRTHKDQF